MLKSVDFEKTLCVYGCVRARACMCVCAACVSGRYLRNHFTDLDKAYSLRLDGDSHATNLFEILFIKYYFKCYYFLLFKLY